MWGCTSNLFGHDPRRRSRARTEPDRLATFRQKMSTLSSPNRCQATGDKTLTFSGNGISQHCTNWARRPECASRRGKCVTWRKGWPNREMADDQNGKIVVKKKRRAESPPSANGNSSSDNKNRAEISPYQEGLVFYDFVADLFASKGDLQSGSSSNKLV